MTETHPKELLSQLGFFCSSLSTTIHRKYLKRNKSCQRSFSLLFLNLLRSNKPLWTWAKGLKGIRRKWQGHDTLRVLWFCSGSSWGGFAIQLCASVMVLFFVQYLLGDVALLNLCCILQARAYNIIFRDPCLRYTCPEREQNFSAVEKRKKNPEAAVWGSSRPTCMVRLGYGHQVHSQGIGRTAMTLFDHRSDSTRL